MPMATPPKVTWARPSPIRERRLRTRKTPSVEQEMAMNEPASNAFWMKPWLRKPRISKTLYPCPVSAECKAPHLIPICIQVETEAAARSRRRRTEMYVEESDAAIAQH